MKRSEKYTPFAAGVGLLLLILDSRTVLEGAREGIDLCIRTVVPSLFPFFVLSGLLTSTLMGRKIPLLTPIVKFTGIPAGSESILLTGFLGGYPIGAQTVAQAQKSGSLSSGDAARMMAFCNNAGPAFIFGMAGAQFPWWWMPWLLWAIHIAGALLVSRSIPGKSGGTVQLPRKTSMKFTDAVTSAVRGIAMVCAWVVLFRVLIAFLSRWIFWMIPESLQTILTGILELANGCCDLRAITNPGLRFVICAGMLSFGGVCVGMQTASVAANVDRRFYFPGKCLHAIFSILLALIFQSFLPASDRMPYPLLYPAALLMILLLIPVKKENYSSIPGNVRV